MSAEMTGNMGVVPMSTGTIIYLSREWDTKYEINNERCLLQSTLDNIECFLKFGDDLNNSIV